MRHKSSRRRALPSTCALCGGPLDYASGFVFPVAPGEVVHPSCFAYQDRVGPVPFGRRIVQTCGEPTCVNPAHLAVQ